MEKETKCWLDILTKEQYVWLIEQFSGKDIIFASVHGSHLYGLNREGSDVDIKAIYAPSKGEVLLGEANKTTSKKNPDLDIELELKSLSSFLKSAKSADTNCFDLLHTPKRLTILHSPMWISIRKNRNHLYAKNMKGLLGYIKVHTNKYTNKIERYDEMVELQHELSFIDNNTKLKDTTISEYVDRKGFKYIKNVTVKSDHEQHYIEVVGKKYILTWESVLLKEALEVGINRYGKRTHIGSDSGMDGKSLSHALRVLFQIKQLLSDGDLIFPLEESEYLMKIKTGDITNPDEVLSKITEEYETVINLLDNSDLPEEVDEYLTYFPEDAYLFTPYIWAFQELCSDYTEKEEKFRNIEDQKEYALAVKEFPFAGLLFQKRKNKNLKFTEMFNKLSNNAKYKMVTKYLKKETN